MDMGGTTGKGSSTGAAGRRHASRPRPAPRGAVARLVERAPSLFLQGKVDDLEQAHDFAPPCIESTGWLIYWKAMCRLGVDPTETIAWFHRAFSLFRASGDRAGLYLAWVGVVQATL